MEYFLEREERLGAARLFRGFCVSTNVRYSRVLNKVVGTGLKRGKIYSKSTINKMRWHHQDLVIDLLLEEGIKVIPMLLMWAVEWRMVPSRKGRANFCV